ncbi:MAG: peptide chain release factor N(5)-glutamine methyltransferase [Thermotogota bacterium]|nr:peptide chain release factor N(5)-glutamine methyltransferase [Thermotogota bacterium]
MKTREIFLKTIKKLEDAGIESPRIIVYNIMEKFLGISRHKIFSDEDIKQNDEKIKIFRDALERIISGVPFDYVLGKVNFLGTELKIDQRALIPRTETEALTEKVIDNEKGFKGNFADIGTGAGAIAVTLAKTFSDSVIYATDISAGALELAKENAKLNGINNINFLQGDCLKPLKPYLEEIEVIVSNPPYIRTDLIKNLDNNIREYEPLVALNGGKEGLDFYKELITGLASREKRIYLEIADYSASCIASMSKDLGYFCEIIRDINGFRRYAILHPASP